MHWGEKSGNVRTVHDQPKMMTIISSNHTISSNSMDPVSALGPGIHRLSRNRLVILNAGFSSALQVI